MRTQFSKIVLAAGIVLSMAFTFGCSSDKDDDTPNDVNNGGGKGALFNENSQIYNRDNTPYNGNGIIEATRGLDCSDSPVSSDGSGGGMTCEWDHIRAGSVAGGIVNFKLNETIPDNEYLSDFLDADERRSCTSYPENIKSAGGSFVLTSNNGNLLGDLLAYYEDSQIGEGFSYYYFSKAGKIACNLQYEDEYDKYTSIFDIDAKIGWNKVYFRGYRKNGIDIEEYSTSDILTKEVKWIFRPIRF